MNRDDFDAIVEGEEFAGGPMTLPSRTTSTGKVRVGSRLNGDWHAYCIQCGAACGAVGTPLDGEYARVDEDAGPMLEDFIAEHSNCKVPSFGEDLPAPSPAAMPRSSAGKPKVWIVKGSSGDKVRVLAERHATVPRPDGLELRFYNDVSDDAHRVASVRPGAWHWVVAETALNPETGEQ